MEIIRQYLISITAAAVVCAMTSSLCIKNGTAGKIIKMLCGIFMALTVIKPMIHINLTDYLSFGDWIEADASAFVTEGENISKSAMEDIIKSKMQAYILDKAESLGGELDVKIELRNGIPAMALLSGNISPYGKTQLSSWLKDELGIPLEAQRWTGQQ